jgi:hypothetical protein
MQTAGIASAETNPIGDRIDGEDQENKAGNRRPEDVGWSQDDQRDKPACVEHVDRSIENKSARKGRRRRLEAAETGLATVGRDEDGRRQGGRWEARLLTNRSSARRRFGSPAGIFSCDTNAKNRSNQTPRDRRRDPNHSGFRSRSFLPGDVG